MPKAFLTSYTFFNALNFYDAPMLSAILSSLSNTLVLLFVGGFGFWLA